MIMPGLQSGRRVITATHGNSLRALVKHLQKISDEEIPPVDIPISLFPEQAFRF
jgi:2,3-bisphosphoglycerate-dependent phosphoglycerate mutase